MHLVCVICGNYIRPTAKKVYGDRVVEWKEVISMGSLYRQWHCTVCGFDYGRRKPKNITECVKCGSVGPVRTSSTGRRKIEPIVHDYGRKFRCAECYNGTLFGSDENNDSDDFDVPFPPKVIIYGV